MDDRRPILELRGVSKRFGSLHVLRGVDLQIHAGTTSVVIGPSGGGKSVLLKHIVGLLRPDEGQVFFEGQRIDDLSEWKLSDVRRRISFVFQLNALFDSMSVGENVAFPLTQVGRARLDRKAVAARVARSLELVGLGGFENKRPAELSGGEKKRAALARAISVDPAPKMILYDEPTTGLDPQRADVINKLIQRLRSELGVTSIVVTHDMKSAAEVGDRILMLYEGRFLADEPPATLANSADPRVRRFVHGEAEPEDVALGVAK